ncbi:DUF4424 domain-containing protein [Ciceribacter sp. L1K23]|uniref:DUF4424 domain-containing protein n=1 Tax=Ciceribacter sp. L1K23 TaxID=2820276 RepID=UPI001B832503|nr:DUF4424 domain-containing protein [Ciceribacter sp. L1K23]MBR0556734.1 DUF4424 domain-containing protein [Ciceribacter sp. L1K23]
MVKSFLALATGTLMAGSCLANDTMAEVKGGGLVYVVSPDVTMAEEDLFISPTKVTVDYVFRNQGNEDVEATIAFPMPDIKGDPNTNVAIPDFEVDNFLGFSVTQDGEEIEPELQQRVLSATGVDVTDELTERGVPLLPMSDAARAALAELPEDVLADWLVRGIIMKDEYDAGNGWESHPTPIWTLRSVYHWRTTFPAGEDVNVHHEYKPGVGGTTAISFLYDGKPNDYNFEDYKTRYCMDDGFVRTATKLQKASEGGQGPYYMEQWLSYILTTGGNWAGSIGKFRLTVDKGSEKSFISFCGKNVKKTGPTTFEMTATDFFPEKDLQFLLLVPVE